MKIFGIGQGRTGTKSLWKAMCMLGYKSKHGGHGFEMLDDYDFVNDAFVAGRWRFLASFLSDSKFILTTREIESWIKSSMSHANTISSGQTRGSMDRQYNRFLAHGTYSFDDEIQLRYFYHKHHADILQYFMHQPNRLLVMNIIAGDGWEKLCPFLDREILDRSFPCRNKIEGDQ